MDIEHSLISKVIETGDVNPVLEIKVGDQWFRDPDHRQVWGFVREYVKEYGHTPTKRVMTLEFPDYQIADAPEPLGYYVDKMATYRRSELLSEGLASAIPLLEDDNPLDAAAVLAKALTAMHTEVTRLRDVDLTTSYQQRLDRYREIQEFRGQMLGYPTGIPTLDLTTAGLRDEQLVTITGLPKAGKSALLMHMALSAHKHGAATLLAGFEMSNEEQSARHDAQLAGIDHLHLIRGGMTADDWTKLEKALRRRKNMQPFVLSADPSSTTTVSTIAAKIEQFQPDIVFVDGVYMMQDEENGEDERKRLTNLTRSFKRLAQRVKRPIVITTQSLEWKTSRSRGLTTSSLGYSSSFVQDSDIVIGAETPNPDDEPDVKRIKIIASRTTPLASCLVHWDWSTGTVTELDGGEDDELVDPGEF